MDTLIAQAIIFHAIANRYTMPIVPAEGKKLSETIDEYLEVLVGVSALVVNMMQTQEEVEE